MSDADGTTQSKSKFYAVLPILLCGLSIPLSLFLWLGNLAFSFLTNKSSTNEGTQTRQIISYSVIKQMYSIRIAFTGAPLRYCRQFNHFADAMALLHIGAHSVDVVRLKAERCEHQRRCIGFNCGDNTVAGESCISRVFGDIFLLIVTGHQISQPFEAQI